MTPLMLWNTMDRRAVPFQPLVPNTVGLYSCGPTVYSYAHLGNLRAFLFVDTLRRVLEYRGYQVKHVMNITDVGHLTDDADAGEDKLELSARRERKSAWEVAAFYTEAFLRDLERLNILSPTVMPRATDHIAEQIALIRELERRGFTYRTSDGIYFDTSQLPDYGKLARLDRQTLQAGARVELNPEKLHPQDFALWKFADVRNQMSEVRSATTNHEPTEASSPTSDLRPPTSGHRQMEWPSPWGKGFPGWHIECSAMSVKELGQPFDIHTGGIEHIPVHHTNEIAQSEAATGKTLANYWLHNEHLLFEGGKMAKSLGNVTKLEDVVERGIDPLAFRYLALGTHYRHPLQFSWDGIQAAAHGLTNLKEQIARLQIQERPTGEVGQSHPSGVPDELEHDFLTAISDDLNTPRALALLQTTLKGDRPDAEKLAAVTSWDRVFGLKLTDARTTALPAHVIEKLERYQRARKERDFTTSDALRAELSKDGYQVEDLPDGSSRVIPR